MVLLSLPLLSCSNSSPRVVDGGRGGKDAQSEGGSAICPGGEGISFTYIRIPTRLDSTAPGSQVVWENGMTFLYIDRECRYWVFGLSASEVEETRTGTLPVEDAQKLAQDLRYSDWASLRGLYEPATSVFGDTPDAFSNGTDVIACFSKCSWNGAPSQIRVLYERIDSWLTKLYSQGQEMTGWVRMAVVDETDGNPTWDYGTAPWPLADSITSYARPVAILDRGTSTRVDQPEADLLRDLRRRQRLGEFSPPFAGGFIPIRGENGHLYGLFLRDGLPFEDEKGLVPLPPPPM